MTSKKQFASQRCWNSSLKINLNDILDMGSNGGDTAMNRANTCRDTSLGPSERPQDEDGSGWTRGWTAAGMAPEPGPSSGHQGQAITLRQQTLPVLSTVKCIPWGWGVHRSKTRLENHVAGFGNILQFPMHSFSGECPSRK